jgi:hypothetical protein
MAFDLRPNPEYKASGWDWLGDIPANRDIASGFNVFIEKR